LNAFDPTLVSVEVAVAQRNVLSFAKAVSVGRLKAPDTSTSLFQSRILLKSELRLVMWRNMILALVACLYFGLMSVRAVRIDLQAKREISNPAVIGETKGPEYLPQIQGT
jgi:hypothetical protein